MRILKRIVLTGACLTLLVALSVLALIAIAPWLDGPILHIAGGPFADESVAFSQLDAPTLKSAQMVEVEVRDISRPSITIGVLVLDSAIFLPATLRPEEKLWPKAIQDDPRIRIRYQDKTIDAFAHKVEDRELHQKLSELGAQKYSASYFEPDKTWYFMVSQSAQRADG